MRVLIVKTSSMGDIIHTLPALTDAMRAIPDITFDWVVEEQFKDIPSWHPAVKEVIPIAFRRLRKSFFKMFFTKEWRDFKKKIKSKKYDVVIDAQGLFKSGFLSWLAKGPKHGLDRTSAREPWVSLFYTHHYAVARNQHAIVRVRKLFSQTLKYELTSLELDYGISRNKKNKNEKKYLVFLPGTTWVTKCWPESYWIKLALLVAQAGYAVRVIWGNDEEKKRAARIATVHPTVTVSEKFFIRDVADEIANAEGVIGVDTGFCHLAAALDVPTISLYGPTDPVLTGTLGESQIHLKAQFPCAPCFNKICTYTGDSTVKPACFTSLPPILVWQTAKKLLIND